MPIAATIALEMIGPIPGTVISCWLLALEISELGRPTANQRQDPEARPAPGTVIVPLRSPTNASPFWIMLLLV